MIKLFKECRYEIYIGLAILIIFMSIGIFDGLQEGEYEEVNDISLDWGDSIGEYYRFDLLWKCIGNFLVGILLQVCQRKCCFCSRINYTSSGYFCLVDWADAVFMVEFIWLFIGHDFSINHTINTEKSSIIC